MSNQTTLRDTVQESLVILHPWKVPTGLIKFFFAYVMLGVHKVYVFVWGRKQTKLS